MSEVILGIDPGTRITGYGVISFAGSALQVLDYGAIRPKISLSSHEKYLVLFESIETLIERYGVVSVVLETSFVGKNRQSAIKLGMARASALLAAARRKCSLQEISPREAKVSLLGRGCGGAPKIQVQRMIQKVLQLQKLPEPEDAADALMLALAGVNRRGRV